MECELRFTVIRRRHHCRACGRLLCSACCSERICLDYMEFREGRVCARCKRTIDRGERNGRAVRGDRRPRVEMRTAGGVGEVRRVQTWSAGAWCVV